jgi:hypothetical protein
MPTVERTQVERLYQLLMEAGTIETLRPLLREIEVVERTGQDAVEIDGLREQVFDGLLRLAKDLPEEASAILLDDLLPLCLRRKEDWPGMSMRGRYDEMLRKWIDEFPGPVRDTLRAAVTSVVADAMKGPRVEPACATIWALGHRTAEIVATLEAIANAHDDEIGDLALRTRVHLGVPDTDRAEVLTELHRKAERRWNHSLVAAFQELADRDSLDVVFGRLKGEASSPEDAEREPFLDDVAMQIPSAIADRYPQDGLLQDGIWRRLMAAPSAERLRSALIMNSSFAARVDSPEVVLTYLGLINFDASVRRDVFYYRLEDLVRPRQLIGWDSDPGDRALSVLRRDACDGTAMEDNWATQELGRKLLAWETLLSLGRADLTRLIDSAVDAETNGYVVAEILNIIACMAVDPLPACVPELIAAVFTRIGAKHDQRLIAHIGAIRVAHSAQSEEAFWALTKHVSVKEEGVLLSLIEALADCAAAMIKSGKLDAETILWQSTAEDQPSPRRIAAAAALSRLIRRRLLQRPCVDLILDRIRDESLDVFARRDLLDASSHIGGGDQEPQLLEVLRTIAAEGPVVDDPPAGTYLVPELGHVALGALARLGVLATDDELLSTKLKLAKSPDGWTAPLGSSGASSTSSVIGLLYAGDPTAFAPAIATLIRDCDWLVLSRLVPPLSQSYHATPPVVIEALVERIHRVQTSRTAEPELFSLLARLSSDRLVREPWGDPVGWMPQARAEFAAAVATARPSSDEVQALLLPLLGDGQYGVRRSAYRAMTSVAPDALATVCESWALTKEGGDAIELRQRAAEAAAWLPDRLRTPEVTSLATDQEPSVRQAFARCERERREREWAAHYLERIVAVDHERDVPIVWRYGRALGKLGDDQALEMLERRRRNSDLSPAIRHWLTRTIKRVRAHWDEATRRWPEPWFARRGRLEEVAGVAVQADGSETEFRGMLWHVVDSEPTKPSSWGGWSTQSELRIGAAKLRISGRRPSEILVSQVSMPSRTTYFSGNDTYPTLS